METENADNENFRFVFQVRKSIHLIFSSRNQNNIGSETMEGNEN